MTTDRTPCPCCGFKHQCICACIPQLDSSLSIALLMHENELRRETNTGKLLVQTVPHCSKHAWQRKSMPDSLAQLLLQPDIYPVVVFPSDTSVAIESFTKQRHADKQTPLFIILDSTWQEAKKMLRKSAWLNELPQCHLSTEKSSNYSLRRNQQSGNLCTCEVGIELLQAHQQYTSAKQLQHYFTHYLAVFHADKRGHALREKPPLT